MDKILKNFIYNGTYKLLLIIIPIITTPYLTRVLGKNQLGIDSYVLSIVTLVELFGAFGINLYSNREIAYCRDNKKELSKIFYEIQYIRIFLCIVITSIYIIVSLRTRYHIVFLIQSFSLIGYFLDVTWLFVGCEDMKLPVIRNTIVKIIQTVLIFSFINDKNDLLKYVWINAICVFVSALCVYPQVPKYIEKVKYSELCFKKHFKPILLLFLPQAASSLYVQFDRTMIGWLSDDISYVSIYDKAESLVKVPLQFISATSQVMIPRVANEFVKGNIDYIKKIIGNEIKIVLLLVFPMAAGIIAISNYFVVWYLGTQYTASITVVKLLTPTIITIGIGEILGSQILISFNKTKEMTIAFSTGAIINIILNSILIPIYNANGAAIATIIAELIVVVIQWYYTRIYVNTRELINCSIIKIIASLIMLFVILQFDNFFGGIISMILKIIAGICIYGFILWIFKDHELIYLFTNIGRKLFKNNEE